MANRTISIGQVRHEFDVRRQLNQDYVYQLALFIEAGTELPPIVITPDNVVIDGRHRLKAYELAGRSEVPYRVERNLRDDKAAMLTAAFNANLGGALPPTSEDIIFGIIQLIEAKASRAQVLASLNMPKEATLKYWKQAAERIRKRKVQEARDLISDNVPINKAAEVVGLAVEDLREAIKENKRGTRTFGIEGLKPNLSKSYQAHSMKQARFFKRVGEMVEVGQLSADDADDLIRIAYKLAQQHLKNLEDWQARLTQGTAAVRKGAASATKGGL